MSLNMISLPVIIGIILAAFGVLSCFWGYKLFKVLLFIIGFGLTFYVSYRLLINFTDNIYIILIVGSILGLAVGILAVIFYFGGVFLIGALFGIIVGLSLNINFDEITKIAIIAALAVVFGVLCIIFQKYLVVVFTSFTGGFIIVNSFFYFYYLLTGQTYDFEKAIDLIQSNIILYLIMLAVTLILGVIGILYQYKAFKKG